MPAGVAGTIAVAMKKAEIARADTAAKTRLPVSELINMIVFSFVFQLLEPFAPDAQNCAGGVPNSKNGGILRFSEYSFMKHLFINPKGWEISPTIRITHFRGEIAPQC